MTGTPDTQWRPTPYRLDNVHMSAVHIINTVINLPLSLRQYTPLAQLDLVLTAWNMMMDMPPQT